MKPVWIIAALSLAASAAQAAEPYAPGSVMDPRLQSATFLQQDGRYFSALIELRQFDGDRQTPEYQLLLADTYLSFGMNDRAQAIYRQLANQAVEPLLLGRAQLRVAEFDFQRGYWAQARALLQRIRENLPEKLHEDWQDLYARVLLAERKYGDAAETLTALDNSDRQSPYTRYNLGVALINDGRQQQGLTVLDKVGRLAPENEEQLALRDRANLSLGWHFLQSQQGGSARPVLSRVRIEGPFSNRALLGLGWAELAPQGERIAKAELPDEAERAQSFANLGALLRPGFAADDVFKRAGLRSFRLSKSQAKEEDALRKALVPWVELISRDPMDPAVQEAWLAIPFTLDRLGAYTQALDYYERAIQVLETARARMNTAMASIRQGRMVETIVRRDLATEAGWQWKLLDLPDAPETYFLQHLLAEHRFQEALKNYRDTRMMSGALQSWAQRLVATENAYAAKTRPAADPDDAIRRAGKNWSAPWQGKKIGLVMADRMAVPGTYAGKRYAPASLNLRLQTAAAPVHFNGPAERARVAQQRIANLRQQLTLLERDHAQLLQDMALTELEGQKRQIELYLIEARFALARLYDRQNKGELSHD
ncbi:lipopolysaccharide assembly protein LapB [Sinimarinibacterium sp. NLF-5-8]|uniref:tetratricopeptide repeat protein n=1 Tax=Sinimarinibacterium sp. NLF-5-8 TaxID=2698684 RepID=UPI00137B9C60|nr:hypothetical protein [Sinimarinibacterium sp. NLF-5-8]QHS09227.1 hypothetical protein GT972_03015 [Sinimarinibacterium sp. NLF-5-8]